MPLSPSIRTGHLPVRAVLLRLVSDAAHRLGIDAEAAETDLFEIGVPEPLHLAPHRLGFDSDPFLKLLLQEPAIVVPQGDIGGRPFDDDGQFLDVDRLLEVIESPVFRAP